MKKRQLFLMFVMLVCIMPMKLWAQEPYAVLNTDTTSVLYSDSTSVTYGQTLTFYYDDQKEARNGMSVGPFRGLIDVSWSPWYITKAVFDVSFANCTSLTSTAFWFWACGRLNQIEGIENLKTDNVTDMRDMFCVCSGLTNIDVSGFKTDNVTDMTNMFAGCSSLTSLDVSGFKTDNVTNMSGMFSGCSGLTSIDVNGFKTDNVTNMRDMFSDCPGLTSIDVSGFKTDNVTNMSGMFSGCSSLTSIDVSGFKTDNVTDMRSMFSGSSLTSISMPSANSLGDSIFSNCTSLKSIEIPATASISSDTFSGIAGVNIHILGDTKAGWSTNNLPKNSTIFVSSAAYSEYSNWISSGIDVHEEGWIPNRIVVTVNTPGQMGRQILSMVNQWSEIEELEVKGHIDSRDMQFFASMTNVRKIDLSQTDITTISGCGALQMLREIILPETVTAVEDNAFNGCTKLWSINLPNVQTIGNNAFYNNDKLTDIELPTATSIGEGAFYYSEITNIKLPAIKSIGDKAFYGCYSLTSVELPAVISIGNLAFNNCYNLTSISMSSSLQSIGEKCFGLCNQLKDVYCYVITPFQTNAFIFTDSYSRPTGITLHVPAFSVSAYKLHPSWSLVAESVIPIGGETSEVTVNSDFTLTSIEGLATKPTLTLTKAEVSGALGHLDVTCPTATLQLGAFEQELFSTDNEQVTLITSSEMTADNVTVKMNLQTDRWHFISLPFDVNMSDIQVAEGTQWAVRRYSGEDRAALTGNTWQDVPRSSVLQANEGYIIQCANEKDSVVCFTFPAVNNEKKNGIFAYGDILKSLNQYESEYAYNRSWNLVGNPYPAYMDATKITHNGVITTWNGNGYTAYSLKDDQYVLRPFEAFFVQRADDAEAMTFGAEGRKHTKDVANNSPRLVPKRAQNNRQVFNFTLADNSYTDRTRLVINPEAKVDYETSCDAAKMLSMNSQTPQLYIVDNSVRYAIDERPVGNGEFLLGMRTNSKGTYTIALQDMAESNTTVVLTDHLTGRETDLTMESYSFTAEGGTTDNRFSITLGGDITGISQIENGKSRIENVFTLDGKQVTSASQPGIYIVSKGGKNRKVVVTK